MEKSKITLTIISVFLLFTSCDIGKDILQTASENAIPATQNIEDAAQSIESATENIESVSENITQAIDELEGVVNALNDAGSKLIGTAGTTMQEVISEFSYLANSGIAQVESSSINIIDQAEISTIRVLNQLTYSGKQLLAQTQNLIIGTADCIDEVMAKRIAQITDSSTEVLDKLDTLLNETVKSIGKETRRTIEFAGQSIVLTISDTTYNIISVILLLGVLFFIGFPLYYLLHKEKGKPVKFKIKIAFLFIIPALICFLLWHNPAYLYSKLGYAVIQPPIDYASNCKRSNGEFTNFLLAYNSSSDRLSYLSLGLDAIYTLNKCCYGNPDDHEIELKRKMVSEVESIIFPPPPPKEVNLADCSGGQKAYNPRAMSTRNDAKYDVLTDLKRGDLIKRLPASYIIASGPASSVINTPVTTYREILMDKEINTDNIRRTANVRNPQIRVNRQ